MMFEGVNPTYLLSCTDGEDGRAEAGLEADGDSLATVESCQIWECL